MLGASDFRFRLNTSLTSRNINFSSAINASRCGNSSQFSSSKNIILARAGLSSCNDEYGTQHIGVPTQNNCHSSVRGVINARGKTNSAGNGVRSSQKIPYNILDRGCISVRRLHIYIYIYIGTNSYENSELPAPACRNA